MELNSLPVFTLPIEDVDLETAGQENDPVDNEKVESSDQAPEYSEESDPLAVQTYNHLLEKGILVEDDSSPFDGTWEKLSESLESLPQRVLNSLVNEAPDISKQIVKWAFSSENLTVDDFKTFAKTYLEELSETDSDIETMDEARDYLEEVYKERGLKPSAIKAALNALEEDDELLDEAKSEKSKQLSTKFSKTTDIIKQNEVAEQERIQRQQTFVSEVSKALDNTGWSTSKIEGVRKVMSNNNIGVILQNISQSPQALVKLADFLTYYDEKNKDIDYSKFMLKAETKEARDFKTKVELAANTPNSNTKSTLKNPNKDDDDELVPVLKLS